MPPVTVWIDAASPVHARRRMQGATGHGMAQKGSSTRDPWTDTALVRCIEDASRQVPRNMAMMANGQILLKLE